MKVSTSTPASTRTRSQSASPPRFRISPSSALLTSPYIPPRSLPRERSVIARRRVVFEELGRTRVSLVDVEGHLVDGPGVERAAVAHAEPPRAVRLLAGEVVERAGRRRAA